MSETPTREADEPQAVSTDGHWSTDGDEVLLAERYRLDDVVGRGGMATVNRAVDTVLDRPVAVKILHPHLANDGAFIDSFLAEARSVASLQHPNVVTVHDFAAGEPTFLVLELVDGTNIRDVLETRGRVSGPEALALLGPVLAGLSHAHGEGLIHRDVKPENMLIRRDGVVKISDFGLAKAAASATVTMHDGGVAGSAHYMAPEVAEGQPATPASDVYSAGVVLYEMLVGRPPFEGETPTATAAMHVTGAVGHPSAIVPGVAPSLDAVVARACDRDPARRFVDAGDMLDALVAAVPEGPSPVDMRDGQARHTIVIPVHASETTVVQPATKRRWFRRSEAAPAQTEESIRLRGRTAAAASVLPDGLTVDRTKLKWFVGVLAAVAVGVALWTQVLFPTINVRQVPDAPVGPVLASLVDSGFVISDERPVEYSAEIPAGHVMRLEPSGRVQRGETITLVTSAGPALVDVPNVTAASPAQAQVDLERLGFTVEVLREFDDTVLEGSVIGTRPPAGSNTAREGQTLELLISRGREPIEVPAIIGSQIEQVEADFADLGLNIIVVDQRNDDSLPEGAIVDQVPSAGTVALRGDAVQVVTSLGPRPFDMPDVGGQTATVAIEALEALGLSVTVSDVPTSFADRRDRVARTSPPAEASVAAGDSVTIFVYR